MEGGGWELTAVARVVVAVAYRWWNAVTTNGGREEQRFWRPPFDLQDLIFGEDGFGENV